jgi:hypothetical protein
VLAHAGAADESLAIGMAFAALWIGWVGWSRLRGTGFSRLPSIAGPGLIAAAVAIIVASAFVPQALFGPTRPSEPPASGAGPRIASTATLAFEEPTEGVIVEGDELHVVLDLQGGTVVEETSSDVRPDTGHIHLAVDGALVSMTYGTVQVVDLRAFGPGEHRLEAEYVAADHLPFDPRVIAEVGFDAQGTG